MNHSDSVNKIYIKQLRDKLKYTNISISSIDLLHKIIEYDKKMTDEQYAELMRVLEKDYSVGWENGIYQNANPCIKSNSKTNCLSSLTIENLLAKNSLYGYLENTKKLFQDETYGSFVTFLFAYCLCSTFTSFLKKNGIYFPYFLQIITNQGSESNFLIKQLCEICDVNIGIHSCCTNTNRAGCIDSIAELLCTTNLEKNKENLENLKDVPVLISEGVDFQKKIYLSLLDNISSTPLDNRYQNKIINNNFNVLPIFIAEKEYIKYNTIKSIYFDEIVAEQSIEYIQLFQKLKKFLSSIVYDFVNSFSIKESKERIDGNTKNYIQEEVYNSEEILYNPRIGITLRNPVEIKSISILLWLLKTFLTYIFEKIQTIKESNDILYKKIETLLSELLYSFTKNIVEINKIIFLAPCYQFVKNPNYPNATKEDKINYLQYLFSNLGLSVKVTNCIERKNAIIYKISPFFSTSSEQIYKKLENIRMHMKSSDILLNTSYQDGDMELIYLHEKVESTNIEEVLDDIKNPISSILQKEKIKIPYIVGYDYHDTLKIIDLQQVHHMLIGGATGSGKSIAVHALLLSVITQTEPSDVRFILMDFKQGQTFEYYENIPHLATKIITDKIEAINALDWLNNEMNRRHKLKNLNKEPEIICIMEEVLSLFHDDKEIKKEMINRLSNLFEKGRSAKIHLILVIQNADENIKKSSIIRNITTKVVLKTSDVYHSNNIARLKEIPAHRLRGKGDMYLLTDNGKLRLQGINVLEKTILSIVSKIKTKPSYLFEINDSDMLINKEDTIENIPKIKSNSNVVQKSSSNLDKKILSQIILSLFEYKKISNSKIMEIYHISFSTANRYIKELITIGILYKGIGKTGYFCSISSFEEIPEEILKLVTQYQKQSIEEIKNYFE